MCTVTVIPLEASGLEPPEGSRPGVPHLRVADNRDELRSRPLALPPERRRFGARLALMPIDPVSDGTWIAVNDTGLVLVLLNGPAAPEGAPAAPPPASRGRIIPQLLAAARLEEVLERIHTLRAGDYGSFRLLALQGRELLECSSERREIRERARLEVREPLLFCSSSLGEGATARARGELFTSFGWKERPRDWRGLQDAFHRHSWADRPDASVCLRHPRARTVSLTLVELRGREAAMTYLPGPPDEGPEPVTARLEFHPPAPPARDRSAAAGGAGDREVRP